MSPRINPRKESPTRTHGMSKTRIWNIWMRMKARCLNKNEPAYKNYGKRGINIDKKWMKFENFYEDMQSGYTEEMTIERKDVNRGYCKSNCTWIPRSEQSRNTTRSIVIMVNGKRETLFDLAKKYGKTL